LTAGLRVGTMAGMAGDDDQPATKADLRHGLAELKEATKADLAELKEATKADLRHGLAELKEASKRDLHELEERFDAKLGAMERRMVDELAGVINRAMGINREDFQRGVSIVDEKYQDIPGRVATLEESVAELQRRPPPAPPRRAARKK
jgi:hypothetical protein